MPNRSAPIGRLLASRINGLHIPIAMIKGSIAVPDKDSKSCRSRRHLPPAVVMITFLGACTTSSINRVRLYNSSTGETVQCGPFATGQPQNCVAHYVTKGFTPAHP